MDLVVGRIGRPHGVRGEVIVDVRTDDPDARFAAGSSLRTDPAERGPLTVIGGAPALRRRWSSRSTASTTGRRPRRCAATVLVVDSAELPAIEDPDELYDHQLVGLAAVDPAGAALGEVADVVHAPASDLLVVRDTDGREHLVPFVRAHRADRRRTRRAGRRRPAGGAVRPVRRRRGRHDLPGVPGRAAARLAAGQGDRARPARRARARPADVDRRRAPHRRRHPVRRGAGHGDAARAVGPGARRDRARRRGARLVLPTPGRPAVHPGSWRTSWRPSRGWSSAAAATRGSTSGWSPGPSGGCRSTRSRSATTCWPAARRRCW